MPNRKCSSVELCAVVWSGFQSFNAASFSWKQHYESNELNIFPSKSWEVREVKQIYFSAHFFIDCGYMCTDILAMISVLFMFWDLQTSYSDFRNLDKTLSQFGDMNLNTWNTRNQYSVACEHLTQVPEPSHSGCDDEKSRHICITNLDTVMIIYTVIRNPGLSCSIETHFSMLFF